MVRPELAERHGKSEVVRAEGGIFSVYCPRFLGHEIERYAADRTDNDKSPDTGYLTPAQFRQAQLQPDVKQLGRLIGCPNPLQCVT
jgi:hypothetical protein